MNAARISAVALISAAALAAAAPLASAQVDPDPMAAGQRVTVGDGRRCDAAGGARADSKLFGSVVLQPGERGMAAEAMVGVGAAPGRYQVTIECGAGGERFTETVTVHGGRVDGVNASQAAGGLVLLALAGGAAYLLRRSVNARS